MSRLFVNLYLDEDVSPLVATLLATRDLVALTTHEAQQRGNKDEKQLLFATAREMAIVTHNRDHFLALAADFSKAGRHHCGIIIAVVRPPHVTTGKLLQLLNLVSAEEMDDQVFFI